MNNIYQIAQMKKLHLDIVNLAGELMVFDDALSIEYIHNLIIPTLSHLNAITEFLSQYTLNNKPTNLDKFTPVYGCSTEADNELA